MLIISEVFQLIFIIYFWAKSGFLLKHQNLSGDWIKINDSSLYIILFSGIILNLFNIVKKFRNNWQFSIRFKLILFTKSL